MDADEVLRPGRRDDLPELLETIGTAAESDLRPPYLSDEGDPLLYYRRVLRMPKGTMGYRNTIIHQWNGVMTGFTVAAPLATFDNYLDGAIPAKIALDRWGDLKAVLNWNIIVVKPEFRRKKITYKLFSEVMKRARKENYKYITGQLWIDNQASKKMLERCEFEFFYEKKVDFKIIGERTFCFCDYKL